MAEELPVVQTGMQSPLLYPDRSKELPAVTDLIDRYTSYITSQILRDIVDEMEATNYYGNFENVKYDNNGAAWYEITWEHVLTTSVYFYLSNEIKKRGWVFSITTRPILHDEENHETVICIYIDHRGVYDEIQLPHLQTADRRSPEKLNKGDR